MSSSSSWLGAASRGSGGVVSAVGVSGAVPRNWTVVGDDLDGLALDVVAGGPFAPFEAAVDGDRAALGQVAVAVLALGAPDGDGEVVGVVRPLPGGLAARVGCDPQRADRRAALGVAQFGVAGEVAGEHDAVEVG